MYVLDTNTLIYFFKNQGQVAQNLANVSPQEIAVSTLSTLNYKSALLNLPPLQNVSSNFSNF